jgi:hypothetical protein
MSWLHYFAQYLGISPELEIAQPGHTRGLWLFYAVVTACFVALVYGMVHTS